MAFGNRQHIGSKPHKYEKHTIGIGPPGVLNTGIYPFKEILVQRPYLTYFITIRKEHTILKNIVYLSSTLSVTALKLLKINT